jgi:hypothetical protein
VRPDWSIWSSFCVSRWPFQLRLEDPFHNSRPREDENNTGVQVPDTGKGDSPRCLKGRSLNSSRINDKPGLNRALHAEAAVIMDRSPHRQAQEFHRYSQPLRSSISAMVGFTRVWETYSSPTPIPWTAPPPQTPLQISCRWNLSNYSCRAPLVPGKQH